jgi:hypothetical protein
MLDMDVGKEIIFSLVGLNNSSCGARVTQTIQTCPCAELDQKALRRKQSSGMWHRVDMVLTDISEERIASIFMVEGKL